MTEPVGEGGPSSFLDSLGDRGRRRAEPRTSIAVAGAGCALGILGVLIVAGDTGVDESTGDFNQLPGVVLSALVVAAGFYVLAQARGAVATAGAVAGALGVPPLMFFLTFDQDKLPPYSTNGILIVSTIVWLGAYAVGPGRGRPFFLGAGLIGFWLTILQLTEKVFTAPFDLVGSFFYGVSDFDSDIDPSTGEVIGGSGFGAPDVPDPSTIGILSLALGVAFLLAGRWLDRGGRHGVATPFALAALPCLTVGVIGLAGDLEAAGSGLLMVLIGVGLAWHGASVWRRATTWIGGGTTALGLAIFLGDMAGDDATVGGMLFIAGGIGMVFAGHALATALSEADEMAVTYGIVAAAPARQVIPPPPPAAEPPPPPDDPSQWAPPASGPDDQPPAPPPPPPA